MAVMRNAMRMAMFQKAVPGKAWLATMALLTMTVLLHSVSAIAETVEVRSFGNPVTEQRYRDLVGTLRCPKCENQAIGDSNSPIAADMRERIYLQLQDGRSDKEIIDYMVNRFGDYVLYNPRLEGRTLLLWGLPAALVMVGVVVLIVLVRSRRKARMGALTQEEQQRLAALIKREGDE